MESIARRATTKTMIEAIGFNTELSDFINNVEHPGKPVDLFVGPPATFAGLAAHELSPKFFGLLVGDRLGPLLPDGDRATKAGE